MNKEPIFTSSNAPKNTEKINLVLEERLKKLMETGLQNEDDVILLYEIEMGKVTVPKTMCFKSK